MSNFGARTAKTFRRCLPQISLAVLILAQCGVASASPKKNNATVYAGSYDVSDGLKERSFIGAAVDFADDDVGYHAELTTIDREESATFGALGVSWKARPGVRAQVRAGTSTDNHAILPDIYASGQLTFEPAEHGWALTPSLSYSHYRSEDWEAIAALEAVRYTDLSFDHGGYYVFQLRAALAPNSSDEVGYSFGAVVTSVRTNGLSLGLGIEAGHSQYETTRALAVRSNFVAIRPSVGVRLNDRVELFVRGEFAHTDLYDVRGATLGLKAGF